MKKELKQLRDEKHNDNKKIKDLNNIINAFDTDLSQIDFNETYVSHKSVINDKYLNNYNTNHSFNDSVFGVDDTHIILD
jgi:hypothetical protein